MIRVAGWQYPIEKLASFEAWRHKLGAAVADAARGGASLLVMPEYASMELTSLLPPDQQATLPAQLSGLQPMLEPYRAAIVEAARANELVIVGGSFPERVGAEYRNRLRVVGPSGTEVLVEKLVMTRFERESWGIAAGSAQPLIEFGSLKLGVVICYDSEFPLIARRLVEAGANVLAVPSCTDTLAGYHRVRIASAARALENQCYAIQVPTVGEAAWSIAVDTNVGAAGVFAPADRGFPEDGVVALGTMNAPGLLFADLLPERVDEARRDGGVLNHRDWSEAGHLAGSVTLVKI